MTQIFFNEWDSFAAAWLRNLWPDATVNEKVAIAMPHRELLGELTRDNVMQHVVVDGATGCWVWKKSKHGRGYGAKWSKGRVQQAHRVVYELLVGPVPSDSDLCHKCDNPPCVNPSHFFIGTRADNMRDCYMKNRRQQARGTAHRSAKLTEDSVREIRRLLSDGAVAKDVATRFGVSPSTIRAIGLGRKWAWLK